MRYFQGGGGRGNCLIRLIQYPPLGMATLDSARKFAIPCYRRLLLPRDRLGLIELCEIVQRVTENYVAGHVWPVGRGSDHPALRYAR